MDRAMEESFAEEDGAEAQRTLRSPSAALWSHVLKPHPQALLAPETQARMQALSLNNMACFFERKGLLQDSVSHLERAVEIEAGDEHCENPAGSHLNLCAVLSQLGRHQEVNHTSRTRPWLVLGPHVHLL